MDDLRGDYTGLSQRTTPAAIKANKTGTYKIMRFLKIIFAITKQTPDEKDKAPLVRQHTKTSTPKNCQDDYLFLNEVAILNKEYKQTIKLILLILLDPQFLPLVCFYLKYKNVFGFYRQNATLVLPTGLKDILFYHPQCRSGFYHDCDTPHMLLSGVDKL